MENFKNSPIVKKLGFNRIILCGVLVLMYILFSIVEPSFVSYSRIISALNYAYFLGPYWLWALLSLLRQVRLISPSDP